MIYSCSVHILCIITHHMIQNTITETVSSVFRHLFHDYAPQRASQLILQHSGGTSNDNERRDIEPGLPVMPGDRPLTARFPSLPPLRKKMSIG